MEDEIDVVIDDAFRKEYLKCKGSPLYWMMNYAWIKNKNGEYVLFYPNIVQRKVYKALKERFFKPYTVIDGQVISRFRLIRLIIVKYRQIGVSTLIILLILHALLFWMGTEALMYLHNKNASIKMLDRVKGLISRLPADMKPSKSAKDYDNRSEVKFHSTDSKVSIGTPGMSEEVAGDQARGDTVQEIMISEMPRYRHQPEFMQGVGEAAANANQYIEATPLVKGDTFNITFDKARRGENDFLALFFAWMIDPNNEKRIDSEEERDEIMNGLSESEQLLVLENPGVMTAEKFKWRRLKISSATYNGNERRFVQENPEDPERCFAGTGYVYFDDPKVEMRKVTTNFRDPIAGHFHVIYCDVAEGLGGDHDSSVIGVIDVDTNEQIFEWARNDLSYKVLHHELFKVWEKYQGFVAVEINEYGHGVVVSCRKDRKYENNKLWQEMIWRDSARKDGFKTGSNRPSILAEAYTAIKDGAECYFHNKEEPLEPVGLRIASPGLIAEMGVFIDIDGKPQASSGNHDDRIMGLVIGWRVRKYAASYRRRYHEVIALLEPREEDFDEYDEY